MKVLFAVNNENISNLIVKKYQKDYKEISQGLFVFLGLKSTSHSPLSFMDLIMIIY